MKPAAYYAGKEQTYVKHFFLERYLETVAFHIGFTHKEFVYVDCFSGPWRSGDEDLADTSIRIALEKLNYVGEGLAARQRHPKIRAIFVEKDKSAFRTLESALAMYRGAVETLALPGAFQDNIPRILSEVGDSFAFFFIDPKGWTGFPLDEIRPILEHRPGEVMVNFMFDFINRFTNFPDEANEDSLDKFYGTGDWRQIRTALNREEASVNLYESVIKTTGAYNFATSTRILKPLHDRAYFYLVYATRSPKGILEFRAVEKATVFEQEKVRAVAQQTQKDTKSRQGSFSFEPREELSSSARVQRTMRLAEANAKILEILKQGPIRFEDLQPYILEIPLVWATDLNTILMDLHKQGRVAIEGLIPRQRVPKAANRISLVRTFDL